MEKSCTITGGHLLSFLSSLYSFCVPPPLPSPPLPPLFSPPSLSFPPFLLSPLLSLLPLPPYVFPCPLSPRPLSPRPLSPHPLFSLPWLKISGCLFLESDQLQSSNVSYLLLVSVIHSCIESTEEKTDSIILYSGYQTFFNL